MSGGRSFVFFDAKEIMATVDKATRQNLSKFGAYVRSDARRSIRKRKKPSAPYKPPSSHVGTLKKGILFGYDKARDSVVVGPVKNRSGNAAQALEHGGTTVIKSPKPREYKVFRVGEGGPIRDANGKERFVRLRTEAQARRATELWNREMKRSAVAETVKTRRIAPRPYMTPAFQRNLPHVPDLFKNSVHK